MRDNVRTYAALLDAMPPSRREALYDDALADVDRTARIPALEVLPAAVRIRGATRVLDQVVAWSTALEPLPSGAVAGPQ